MNVLYLGQLQNSFFDAQATDVWNDIELYQPLYYFKFALYLFPIEIKLQRTPMRLLKKTLNY